MRDALVITLTLIVLIVILGYIYTLMGPYLVKLGVIDNSRPIVTKDDGGVFRSVDFGRTWSQQSSTSGNGEFSKSDVFDIIFSPKYPQTVFAASSNGLFVSDNDGNTWGRALSQEIAGAEAVHALAIDLVNSERMYVAVSGAKKQGKILKTRGNGFYEVYSTVSTGSRIEGLWIDPYDTSVIFAGTSHGLLLVSRDFGESWQVLSEFSGPISSLIMTPQDTRIMYLAVGGEMFTTSDQGLNWQKISKSVWQELGGDFKIHNFVFDPFSHNTIYIATTHGLFRSFDGALSVERVALPVGVANPHVGALHIAREKANLLYIGVDSQIYRSDDAGQNWQIKRLESARRVNVIKLKPGDMNVVFAGVKL